MFEDEQIWNLIQNESIRVDLYEELNKALGSALDYKTLPYDISFISSEYFIFNKEYKAAPYKPEMKQIVEGSAKYAELYIPPNVIKVTTMNRPRTVDISKFLLLLSSMRIKKLFFQPFYTSGRLTLFKPAEQSGVITRIGVIYEHDESKAVE